MRSKKATMDVDENGNTYLTERYLRALCEENEQYSTPKLNSCLYLHYKGFRKIEALESYVNLKALWLESNGIEEITGISHLEELRMLYLHQNIIHKIEGLSTLANLVTLNLSHNSIKEIENLGGCYSLKNLDLSHNMIVDYSACKGLKDCPSITSCDLSHNYIEYDKDVCEFFFQFQNFKCFYLKGNPAVSKIKMYRKTMINGLKGLLYLDDRPVKELDRKAAEAYITGGREAENDVRKEHYLAEKQKMKEYINYTNEIRHEAQRKREMERERLKKDAQQRKDALVKKRDNFRELLRNARANAEEKQRAEDGIEACEEQLNSFLFDVLRNDDFVVPPLRVVADQRNQPGYQERQEQLRREQREREARDRELREYEDRERVNMPKAGSIIPNVVPEAPQVKSRAQRMRDEGVVVSTDSESDNDPTASAKRAGYRKEIFKWTEVYEDKLEELLIQHMFDFIKVAHEFSALVNDFDSDNNQDKFYYEITPKILQMKWTDIEIKNHRMAEFTKDEEEDDEEDDLKVDTDRNNEGTTDEKTITNDVNSTLPSVNRLHDFSSSSEDGDYTGTNLEELD